MSTTHRASRTSNPPSRPTTPIRPSSRTSLRSPHALAGSTGSGADPSPLATLEPGFAELADSMADLEANMMHLQLLHESLARFGENFAAFLYGLNMNAFCVDFPEGPTEESWRRAAARAEAGDAGGASGSAAAAAASPGRPTGSAGLGGGVGAYDPETTFMTTDTSFVEHPPQSTRGGGTSTRSRRASAARGSGIARGAGATRGTAGVGRGAANVAAGGKGAPVVRGTRASGLARASTAARGRAGRA